MKSLFFTALRVVSTTITNRKSLEASRISDISYGVSQFPWIRENINAVVRKAERFGTNKKELQNLLKLIEEKGEARCAYKRLIEDTIKEKFPN